MKRRRKPKLAPELARMLNEAPPAPTPELVRAFERAKPDPIKIWHYKDGINYAIGHDGRVIGRVEGKGPPWKPYHGDRALAIAPTFCVAAMFVREAEEAKP